MGYKRFHIDCLDGGGCRFLHRKDGGFLEAGDVEEALTTIQGNDRISPLARQWTVEERAAISMAVFGVAALLGLDLHAEEVKQPDPNCERCKGKGYTEWSSTMGGKPYASGRDKCPCSMTAKEKSHICPDCNKDWGHSYCGTCVGTGKV